IPAAAPVGGEFRHRPAGTRRRRRHGGGVEGVNRGLFPQQFIDDLRLQANILQVVQEYVPLKKAGSTYKGLCPFHSEKTPSFTVTPARDSWKCFGCGEGGDIFNFVMRRDGLSFPEALKVLAAKAGVELAERTTREGARRRRLQSVLESAIAFYHAVLTGSKAGELALEYLRGRGFTDETTAADQLG